ncbi:hypothetical protein [Pedobacter foliorum]|uniref:hypothetical protein n=1 Tax=Pedobacter foliorum TaxID=2739058 RepID=UPI0015642489|nr:hypothetical protein [Pedobacter foliorum]NRF37423.1 hypothetical protein [Pedobacter foliorum]
MKKLFILLLFIAGAMVVNAQIRSRNQDQSVFTKPIKTLNVASTSKHDELLKRLTSVMQPVVDKLKKLMEANPETYKAYQEAIHSVSKLKSTSEKEDKIAMISKTYYSFVKRIWTAAEIDEPYYQEKIREVFPDEVKKKIKFGEFLTFQYEVNKPVAPYTPVQTENPTTPPIINKPDDPNPFICVNDNTTAKAIFDEQKAGVGVSSSMYYASSTGSLANTIVCLANTLGPWGSHTQAGITVDNFNIPGRYPLDSRSLKVTKDYHWKASAYTVSILGCAITYYYQTPVFASALKDWQTEICICAPATFVLVSNKNVDKQFSSQAPKQSGNITAFGLGSAIIAGSSGLAYAGGDVRVQSKKWQICETP